MTKFEKIIKTFDNIKYIFIAVILLSYFYPDKVLFTIGTSLLSFVFTYLFLLFNDSLLKKTNDLDDNPEILKRKLLLKKQKDDLIVNNHKIENIIQNNISSEQDSEADKLLNILTSGSRSL